ncbi:SAM-dependent methyltransferase [Candidatus Woesebacteria bacterium]|nr:SAM-dependent methyltransferase [Candidatus Woesebacteria bacterium]
MGKKVGYLELTGALTAPDFVWMRISGDGRAHGYRYKKITIRPVVIKNRPYFQISFWDGKKDIAQNYEEDRAFHLLGILLRSHITSLVIQKTDALVQYEVKDGQMIERIHKSNAEKNVTHDKVTTQKIPLTTPFLQVIGLTTADGKIVSERKDKWKQVTEFIKQVETTCTPESFGEEVVVVDFGCGNAYLTFCLYYYLKEVMKLPVTVIGIDQNTDLIYENNRHARECGFEGISFQSGEIKGFQMGKIDIAVALHACDTATDDALIAAVESNATYIFVSPCCHHHLQAKKEVARSEEISRFPILRERLTDIVTDTARGLAVGARGYKVDLFEFVPDIHTPRNVLIRAHQTESKTSRTYFDEFTKKWNITPYIAQLLPDTIK